MIQQYLTAIFFMMKKIAKQAADEEGRISNYWGTRVNPLEMMEWINSRPTAKENPYYLTKILASISIRDNGGPCNVKID